MQLTLNCKKKARNRFMISPSLALNALLPGLASRTCEHCAERLICEHHKCA